MNIGLSYYNFLKNIIGGSNGSSKYYYKVEFSDKIYKKVICWYKIDKDNSLKYNHMETYEEYDNKYKDKFGEDADKDRFRYPIPISEKQKQWENESWIPAVALWDLESGKIVGEINPAKDYMNL